MKKAILTATVAVSLTTVSFASGLHEVSSISTNSFPPPVLELAS